MVTAAASAVGFLLAAIMAGGILAVAAIPFLAILHDHVLDEAEYERQVDALTFAAQAQYDAHRRLQIAAEQSRSIDGDKLLTDIYGFLRTFIAYPTDEAAIAHTLWVAHTWHLDTWTTTPRLAFLSSVPGSGKSRALEVTEALVPDPILAINTTATYLLRRIAAADGSQRPTILYDEIDTVFTRSGAGNEALRGLLNAGYRKGAITGRATGHSLQDLPCYAAIALAGLGHLPDTVRTRSIVIQMEPRDHTNQTGSSLWTYGTKPYRPETSAPHAQDIRDRLGRWFPELTVPNLDAYEITDRNAEIWEPLLAVADAAGGQWGAWGRATAVRFS